jgi:hypothetical protein
LGLNQNQTMAVGLKGQGGLIMRILGRTLMTCCYPIFDPYFDKLKKIKIKIKNKDLYVAIT